MNQIPACSCIFLDSEGTPNIQDLYQLLSVLVLTEDLGFIPYIIKCSIKRSQHFSTKSITTLLAVKMDFPALEINFTRVEIVYLFLTVKKKT